MVSGVKGSPGGGCRAQRDAEHPWGRRGGPVACAARPAVSGGEAASFHVLWARAAGWSRSRGLACRVRAEQGLTVVAAEQERELAVCALNDTGGPG